MSTLKVDNLLLQDNTKGTGRILETFGGVCNGQSFDVLSGTYQLETVTTEQDLTTSFVDVTGSSITYTPPEGTKTVAYEFSFVVGRGDTNVIANFRAYIDSDEIVQGRFTTGNATDHTQLVNFKWMFNCNASSADANVGSLTSWTTPKTIHMEAREHSSSTEATLHNNFWYDGSSSLTMFRIPLLQITAIG